MTIVPRLLDSSYRHQPKGKIDSHFYTSNQQYHFKTTLSTEKVYRYKLGVCLGKAKQNWRH